MCELRMSRINPISNQNKILNFKMPKNKFTYRRYNTYFPFIEIQNKYRLKFLIIL